MYLNPASYYKKKYSHDPLRYNELALLSLTLLSLPSLEAPKNIFLVLFLATSLYRKFKLKNYSLASFWDYTFSFCLGSFLTGAIFSGISGGDEWGGFWSSLIWIGFAWIIS
jgi:hypothetical protein